MNIDATAYHEAGHAVAACEYRIAIKELSIISDEQTHGRMLFKTPIDLEAIDYDNSNRTRIRAELQIIVALAGGIAQRRRSARSMRRWHTEGDHKFAAGIAMRLNGDVRTTSACLARLELVTENLIEFN